MYHKKMNGNELGIVPLVTVTNVCPTGYKKKKFCMEIHTPDRIYYMCAGSDADRDGWIEALTTAKKALEKKATPTSTTNGNGANNASPVSHEDKITIKDFDLLNVVGKGSFGKVMQVRKKDNGKIYAMKVLNKKTILDRGELAHTKAEKNILQKLVHPFLVNLVYAFQTEDKLYFIMDYINGGELFFHLQKEEKFSDDRVQFYCA